MAGLGLVMGMRVVRIIWRSGRRWGGCAAIRRGGGVAMFIACSCSCGLRRRGGRVVMVRRRSRR